MPSNVHRRSSVLLAVFFVAAAPLGCGGDPARGEDDPGSVPLGRSEQALTADDIMARAKEWVVAGKEVPYCSVANGMADPVCGGICTRPPAAWDAAISSCSGYVSWCWGLPAHGSGVYMTDRTGPDGWTTVPFASLSAGDAFVATTSATHTTGHMMIFSRFTAPDTVEVYHEPACGKVAAVATRRFTLTSAGKTRFASDDRVYHVIRRNGLTVDRYAASLESQSWPKAGPAPWKLTVGEEVKVTLTLKNIGDKAWDSNTKLGTTTPRDRVSPFAASDWLGPTRVSAVSGSVAPGASHTFTFALKAPKTPGTYHEYWNLVEEGVVWFADQGGPADNVLEAYIEVADPTEPAGSDAGGTPPETAADGGPADGGAPSATDGAGLEGSCAVNAAGSSRSTGRGAVNTSWLAGWVAYGSIVARRRRRGAAVKARYARATR